LLAAAHFTLGSMTVAHKTFRTFLRSVVATAFALLATTAQPAFYSGPFDPPDLSGFHTFELVGDCVHGGTYELTVNNGGACDATLTSLTVLLDHSFALDFSDFIPFSDINSILVENGQLVGVDTDLIGAANVSEGTYAGDWWIRYYYFFGDGFASDPVDLLHDPCSLPGITGRCVEDTAYTVTFFLSDANGNPINQTPEPGSLVLIAAALGAGWLARRRVAASN
jgi:hypothetical protein